MDKQSIHRNHYRTVNNHNFINYQAGLLKRLINETVKDEKIKKVLLRDLSIANNHYNEWFHTFDDEEREERLKQLKK